METALAAAYRAIRARLTSGAPSWGTRTYVGLAPAGSAYPYVLFFWSGGGERNRVRARDAELVISVKCVADTLPAALAGAAEISARMNDRGTQDSPADCLTAGLASEWRVLTVTEEQAIELNELFAGASPVYHQGARFRLVMEAK